MMLTFAFKRTRFTNIPLSFCSLKVNMGDLQSEEERDVVIKLSLEALPDPRESPPQPLFDVVANYFNVISAELAETKASLSVMRTSKSEKYYF